MLLSFVKVTLRSIGDPYFLISQIDALRLTKLKPVMEKYLGSEVRPLTVSAGLGGVEDLALGSLLVIMLKTCLVKSEP